jgi:hypothetical protein
MEKLASTERVRARENRRTGRLAAALLAAGLCSYAWSTTFTVTSTSDAGAGSLRQAILDVNADTTDCTTSTPHSIVFAIPGAGVHTISPLTPLPAIIGGVTIDGYSQPGASANTLITGTNAVLQIVLDGTNAGAGANGLVFTRQTGAGARACGPDFSTVTGLVIRSFSGAAIASGSGGNVLGVRVRGNYIGTDATGTTAAGNGASGVAAIELGTGASFWIIGTLESSSGGPPRGSPTQQFRNVISGNLQDGVHTASGDLARLSTSNSIRGNYIGLNAAGTGALGNQRNGVFLDAGSGLNTVEDNYIATNGADGLRVDDTQNNTIAVLNNAVGQTTGGAAAGNLGNGMHFSGASTRALIRGDALAFTYIVNNAGAGVLVENGAMVDSFTTVAFNGGLGIDLAPLGVTANDPQDADTGPNNLQNWPVLTSASSTNNNVQGTINSTPNARIEIYFYYNDACDASGNGEGQFAVHSGGGGGSQSLIVVNTDASGNASFNSNLAGSVFAGKFLTATARGTTFPFTTSEFSNCVQIAGAVANPGTLQFSSATYSVNESAGTATITVTRTGGSSGAVSALVSTSNGTATAGVDYTATSTTVNFADGDTAPKTVTIPIINDALVEGNETVLLALSSATGGATIAVPDDAVLTIVDDDVGVPPQASVTPIPTLGEWALFALIGVLALLGGFALRTHRGGARDA